MEKKIMYCVIVCSIMFWCFAINVKAEENDLIMYDYVHQTEHKYSIGLDRKLQKTKKIFLDMEHMTLTHTMELMNLQNIQKV